MKPQRLRNILLLSAFCWLLLPSARAQYRLTGIVQDNEGQPLIGASVYIQSTLEGTTTDTAGRFAFSTQATGRQTLVISYMGYQTRTIDIDLDQPQPPLQIRLREEFNKLDDLVITAGSFAAGEEAQREVLKPLDIATTAGATADIAGALNALPGTQTVGEEGRLFVRGGDSYETRTYIDGLLVFKPYSVSAPNTPVRNRFSPFMFKGMSFSTGGYTAEYGQALSSVLALDTKDRPLHTRTDLGLMSVGLEAAQVVAGDKSSLAAKLAYYNLQPYYQVVPQRIDWQRAPATFELNAAYRVDVSSTGTLKSYIKYGHSTMSYNDYPVGNNGVSVATGIDNDYLYGNVSYRGAAGQKWGLMGGASFTQNHDVYHTDTSQIEDRFLGGHAKMVLSRDLTSRIALHLGGEGIFRQVDSRLQLSLFNRQALFNENLGVLFAETEIYLTNKLLTRVGLRFEGSNMGSQAAWQPRASLAFKTGEYSQLSAAAGHYRQAPRDRYWLIAPALDYEQATHYIVNYQISRKRRTFRAEAYYKVYDNLTKYDPTHEYEPAAYTNGGSGYARGLDIFWRDNKTIRNADYWVSYSYLDTERDYAGFPAAVVPAFASTHNISVVYKQFVSQLQTQFSATYSFASGRPYTDPNTGEFNSKRSPAYHDLSLSVSYLVNNYIILHGSVTNVLGRDNVFGYEYARWPDQSGMYAGRAIKQPALRMYFIGVFITLSKEKTLNQLQTL